MNQVGLYRELHFFANRRRVCIMHPELKGNVVRRWEDLAGVHAAVELIEQNGDVYEVEWLLRPDGLVDIGAEGEIVPYLQQRYGSFTVFHVVSDISLG